MFYMNNQTNIDKTDRIKLEPQKVIGGKEEKHAYYFGNLDCFRMVANRTYYAPLTPEKKYPRIDPYDSQSGEAETDDHGLTDDEFDTEYTMLWHEITDAI